MYEKFFISMALLLLAHAGARAKDVTLTVVDARGQAAAHIDFTVDGMPATTDAQGQVTVDLDRTRGAIDLGWPNLKSYNSRRLRYDATSGAATVELPLYCSSVQLDGLTADEAACLKGCCIDLGDRFTYRWNGTASMNVLIGPDSVLDYHMNEPLFGLTQGTAQVEAGKPITISPKAGKRKLTLGAATPHADMPITTCAWDSLELPNPPVVEPVVLYRPAEQRSIEWSAPGYLPHIFNYDLTETDVTLAPDLSEAKPVRIKATDRDSSPLAGATIKCSGDSVGQTGTDGTAVFYALPHDSYTICLVPTNDDYPELEEGISIHDATTDVNFTYEGYRLVQISIKSDRHIFTLFGHIEELDSPDAPQKDFSTGNGSQPGVSQLTTMLSADEFQSGKAKLHIDIFGWRSSSAYLPIEISNLDVSKDVNLSYDIDTWRPVRFIAPDGVEMYYSSYRIDGMGTQIPDKNNPVVYMPQGHHEWTPDFVNKDRSRVYYDLPARAFDLGDVSEPLQVSYDIPANLPCVKLKVTGFDGQPAANFRIFLKKSETEATESWYFINAYTDAEGTAELYVPGQTEYSGFATLYEGSALQSVNTCKPLSFLVRLDDGAVTKALSFADYHAVTIRATGMNPNYYAQAEAYWRATPEAEDEGTSGSNMQDANYDHSKYYHFKGRSLNRDATSDQSTCSLTYYMPNGYFDGTVKINAGEFGSIQHNIAQTYISSAQTISIDVGKYQSISYMHDGQPTYSVTVYPADASGRPIEGCKPIESDRIRLLPPGHYYACYLNTSHFQPGAKPVHFEVVDQPVTVEFTTNEADYHALDFSFSGAPFDVVYAPITLAYEQMPDSLYYNKDNDDVFAKGNYSYLITTISPSDQHDYSVKKWSVIKQGSFEIGDTDATVNVDFSDLRFFTVTDAQDADGHSVMDTYDNFMNITAADGTQIGSLDGLQFGLPVGEYAVELMAGVDDDGQVENQYYGTLTVTPETPSEVVLTVSKERPTGINAARISALGAKATAGGLLINGTAGEDVRVEIFDMAGRRAMTTTARPGTTIATTPLAGGTYIVRLAQGTARSAMKFMR